MLSDDSFGGFANKKLFGMTPMSMEPSETVTQEEYEADLQELWETEEDLIDRSVRILPGVRRMIDSIPDGRHAVATSGAQTYGEPSFL